MKSVRPLSVLHLLAAVVALPLFAACSDDDTVTPRTDAGSTSVVDSGTTPVADAGTQPTTDAAPATDASAVPQCTAAKEQLLKPVDSVSTGLVTTLSNSGGVRVLFVDGSAGGSAASAANPRIYVNLETGTRVDVTDKTAEASTAWDLAIKRPVIFQNSGNGGPGVGGAVMLTKDFDAVTTADATAATFLPETFFDAQCNPKLDATAAVKTSFDGWYDYDATTHIPSPHPAVWLVKGGTGKLFKVQILSYMAAEDGGVGTATAKFTFKVAAL